MIFLTVGAQMPFDRLVRAVDNWAEEYPQVDVHAQVGDAAYVPRHLQACRRLAGGCFEQRFAEARVIVGHAGMGTIITAMQLGKPLIVMPRRAALGETRNDHQVATALQFIETTPLAVAWDEHGLPDLLDQHDMLPPMPRIGSFANPALLEAVYQAVQPNRSAPWRWLTGRRSLPDRQSVAVPHRTIEPKPEPDTNQIPTRQTTTVLDVDTPAPLPLHQRETDDALRRAA